MLIVYRVYTDYINFIENMHAAGKSEVENRAIVKKKKRNKKGFQCKHKIESNNDGRKGGDGVPAPIRFNEV